MWKTTRCVEAASGSFLQMIQSRENGAIDAAAAGDGSLWSRLIVMASLDFSNHNNINDFFVLVGFVSIGCFVALKKRCRRARKWENVALKRYRTPRNRLIMALA